MSSVTVCNCPQNTPDLACLQAMSSRPSDQQQKKPDGHTCWTGSAERRLDGCWLNAGAGGKQCPKPVCLRCCLWQIMQTTKDLIYLLTYINHNHASQNHLNHHFPGDPGFIFLVYKYTMYSAQTCQTHINKQLKLWNLITFSNCFST